MVAGILDPLLRLANAAATRVLIGGFNHLDRGAQTICVASFALSAKLSVRRITAPFIGAIAEFQWQFELRLGQVICPDIATIGWFGSVIEKVTNALYRTIKSVLNLKAGSYNFFVIR